MSTKVCPKVYKSVYVVNSSFCDPEKECEITRRFNLYGSGHHIPPVALSVPSAIESIKEETSEEFEQVHGSVLFLAQSEHETHSTFSLKTRAD